MEQDHIFKSLIKTASGKNVELSLLISTLENRSLNYLECYNLIQIVSEKIIASGFSKGDIIVSYNPMSVESIILFWGCMYTGLIFVPVDHNWPSGLLKQILKETTPCLVMTDEERLSCVSSMFPIENIILAGRGVRTNSFYQWLENKTSIRFNLSMVPDPEDVAAILYTSGSTGAPKGVMLSQKALFNSSKLFGEFFNWQSSDIFMNLGDLHTMNCLRNTCITPLHTGSAVVIAQPEERNSVLHIFDIIQNQRVTYINLIPLVVKQMIIMFSEARKKKLSSLKALLCTGNMLTKDLLEKFYSLYDKPIYNCYGMTETTGFCSGHNASTFSTTDNSIGKPFGVEYNLIPDPVYNNPNIGELLIKSNNLMVGYYRREKETLEVLKNGCFYTGDIVLRRTDGNYELLGRKKNTVKNIHAELIHLEEIDFALESHRLIKEACSCSYSIHEGDEKIIAFVVPKEYPDRNEEKFINEIKENMLLLMGKDRVPLYYYIEKELPRNTLGKILRQKLMEKLYVYIQSKHRRYF